MERKATKTDLYVLTLITTIGILLSALFVWTYVGGGDSGRDIAEMLLVGAAWAKPLGAVTQISAQASVLAGRVMTTTL